MRRSDRIVFVLMMGFMFSALFCLEKKVDTLNERISCLSSQEDPHVPALQSQAQRIATLEGQMHFLDSSVEKIWNGEGKK